MTNLEARTTRLVPATLYSRMLARDGRGGLRHPTRRERSGERLAAAPLSASESLEGQWCGGTACRYFRGSTASLSCLAIRALTTVLAGILIASPVAGFRPIRALRF